LSAFRKGLVLFGLTIGIVVPLYGQVDSVLTIPAVEIVHHTIRHQNVGSIDRVWSKKEIEKRSSNSIPELLQQDGVYIKSYGLGSLATSSIRGGSAGHTLLLWNGLPISSPMLGQLDLSLISLGSFNSVEMQRGGGSSLWGSGAIGGVVRLNSRPRFSQGVQFNYRSVFGDFGRITQNLHLEYGGAKLFTRTHFEYREARNDFRYTIAEGFPKRKQPNAELSQRLFTQDIGWKLNDRNLLMVNLWHQDAHREIPPTNVQFRSLAYQNDESTRLKLGYEYEGDLFQLNVNTAYFEEAIFYADPIILLESPSSFTTRLIDVSAQFQVDDKNTLLLGQTFTNTEAITENYRDAQVENRFALFGSWRITKDRLNVQASLRQELIDGNLIVPIPSLGVEFRLSDQLWIRGKFSRNFRLPTLNDRYWSPGGNPNLESENGWSQEASIEYTKKFEHITLTVLQSAFNRNIDDWIMWNPGEGGIWSASNITSVRSRGSESRIKIEWSRSATWQCKMSAGYDRILSTNEGNLDVSGMDTGEQLLYTPKQLAFVMFSLRWKGLTVSYRHAYTGESRGINESIPEFNTGDLRLQVEGNSISKPSFRSSFFLDIMNLYNAEYVVIDRRPMPGINLQAGIRIHFHTSKNKI